MLRSIAATALLLASQANGLKSVTDGCKLANTTAVEDGCLVDGELAGVRCCTFEGDSCSSFCPGGADSLVDYTTAVGTCDDAGMRLCSRAEIDSDLCCDTGCGYDDHQAFILDDDCSGESDNVELPEAEESKEEEEEVICPYDGNLEVLLPPLLDEDATLVVLTSDSSSMQVQLTIPKQYQTVKVDFEGAAEDGAAFDSEDPNTYMYWSADAESDPCNHILTSAIPWDLFRSTLGGVSEDRFFDAVYYTTLINIETTLELELTPETLLEEGERVDLLQTQTLTRTVATRIPFEVKFELDLKLWANANVTSDHLRVASALIDSTVLEVDPDQDPIADAQLEFVTVIPLPLILDSADITVDHPDLAYGLTVEEVESKRDCVESAEFCTQYWLVDVEPRKCDLNGQYTATVHGVCHPDSTNCIHPSPDYSEIVMDVLSDDYCGVTQQIDIVGSLALQATECNDYMHGTVTVSNPDGGAINNTEIIELVVSPTLLNSEFLTIYDELNAIEILNYEATLSAPNQVDFSFEWRGSELRCDVVASVDAVVLVEFEATAPLLLEASSGRRGHSQSLFDSQDMRMSDSVSVGADASTSGSGADADADSDPSLVSGGSAASTSPLFTPLVIGIIAGLSALIVLVVVGGVVYSRRSAPKVAPTPPPVASSDVSLVDVSLAA